MTPYPYCCGPCWRLSKMLTRFQICSVLLRRDFRWGHEGLPYVCTVSYTVGSELTAPRYANDYSVLVLQKLSTIAFVFGDLLDLNLETCSNSPTTKKHERTLMHSNARSSALHCPAVHVESSTWDVRGKRWKLAHAKDSVILAMSLNFPTRIRVLDTGTATGHIDRL